MIRVHVIVEGSTEESFIKGPLAETFWHRNIFFHPALIGKPGHKGGHTSYARLKKDVMIQLKQDRNSYCTTMLDLYRLGPGYPGTPLPEGLNGLAKAHRIESAVKADISDRRFIPYLSVHEFEGLLFSDPEALALALNQPHLVRKLLEIRNQFDTPEHINDSVETAPSKRLKALRPGYRKAVDGTLAAQAIGIATMRSQCPHFAAWLSQLENLTEI